MAKPKVAFYWCASCGGCEEAVVDLNQALLDVTEAVEVVFWPVALDFKVEHVRALGDGELAVAFINGAIRTSEQEDMAKLLRAKSQLLVAFGSCAHLGGIPGLANLVSKQRIFDWAYRDAPTVVNPGDVRPEEHSHYEGKPLVLPRFHDRVRALDQVVPVDYYLPGCAPPESLVAEAIGAILQGKLPATGSVLAPDRPLCDSCPRRDSKPAELRLERIVRVHEVEVDPTRCFLEAGVLCLGMGTRSGCGERCLNANMPCNGCFGPTSKVLDPGAKLLSAVASLFGPSDQIGIEELVRAVPDPAGTFYRYSLPKTLLKRGV